MNILRDGMAATWNRLWFAGGSPLNLAAARVVVSVHALWLLLSRDLAGISGLPAVFFSAVPPSARWRYLLWEGHPGLESALVGATAAALITAALGIWPRTSCLVSGLLLYHLAPLETLILTPSPWLKGLTLSVPALVILSLSPCGAALRVGRRPPPAVDPEECAWPLRLIQLLLCLVYLWGGVAKLVHAGPGWASGDNMRAWLLLANLDEEQALWTAPGLWIADRPMLCRLMGAAALGLDFGFVLAFFSRRARAWLVPATALFHLAILVTLNYLFLNLPQLLLFVDWDALRKPASPR